MTEEQAKRGLEVLKERRAEGEYFGFMWATQIEQRVEQGESLTQLVEVAVETAKQWEGVAKQSYHPTGEQQETVSRLLEAVNA